mmetsp:Transcript_30420/g.76482  ORF Transcript_30420/g.76482 Transcript_30420/m.76482 type:complete len:205 (-) Transcript_30420:3967-4581(-)
MTPCSARSYAQTNLGQGNLVLHLLLHVPVIQERCLGLAQAMPHLVGITLRGLQLCSASSQLGAGHPQGTLLLPERHLEFLYLHTMRPGSIRVTVGDITSHREGTGRSVLLERPPGHCHYRRRSCLSYNPFRLMGLRQVLRLGHQLTDLLLECIAFMPHSQVHMDSCNEFHTSKWFSDVVIATCVDGLRRLLCSSTASKHDDGQL